MEPHPYFVALAALDAAEIPAPVYRTARRLLDQAMQANQPGYIEINHDQAKDVVGSEAWGTVRSHLIQLETIGLIKKWLNHSCRVYFVAYPPPAWLEEPRDLPTNSRAERSLSRDLPTEPQPADDTDDPDRALSDHFRANHQQIRALDDQNRALGDHFRAILDGGKGLGWVGNTYTPNNTGITQPNPPAPEPATEAPDPDAIARLKPDQQWAYALLTDPEIGILPDRALACVKWHTASYTIRQVASWWLERDKVGVGALVWRMMNPGKSRPGPASAEFLASDLYRRHYPLDEQQQTQWQRWLGYRDYLDVMSVPGVNKPEISADIETLLDQLPAPPAVEVF